MSKRAGSFVTLRDLIEEVGRDAVRFTMLTRKSDAQMEFDLDAVVAQTRDNPVFYVQYAHARCRSVLRAAAEMFGADAVSDAALAEVAQGNGGLVKRAIGDGTSGAGTLGDGKLGAGTLGEATSGEATLGDGTSDEATSGEGTSGNGTVGEGVPSDGKPDDGVPGEGRTGAGASDDAAPPSFGLDCLVAEPELALIRRLAAWPRTVEAAALASEPHRIAFFLYDLAGDFHMLWNRGQASTLRFLQPAFPGETLARLALVAATAVVIRSGLAVMGVVPVEEMR